MTRAAISIQALIFALMGTLALTAGCDSNGVAEEPDPEITGFAFTTDSVALVVGEQVDLSDSLVGLSDEAAARGVLFQDSQIYRAGLVFSQGVLRSAGADHFRVCAKYRFRLKPADVVGHRRLPPTARVSSGGNGR